MSNMVKHAETELRKAGLFEPDSDYDGEIGRAVLELVKTLAAQEHSGGSVALTLAYFQRVALFKQLSPLTAAADEWMQIGDSPPVWQSTRASSCFSMDGGATYYDIDAPSPLWHRVLRRLGLTSTPLPMRPSKAVARSSRGTP